MQTGNLHTHTTFSDGAFEPKVYLAEAITRQYDFIGFSDHAPIPGNPVEWAMPLHKLISYVETIRALKKEFGNRIQILAGLEVDYIPGVITPDHRSLRSLGLDFIIGAVHFLEKFAEGRHCSIDDPADFRAGIQKIYKNDIRAVVTDYYRLIQDMVNDHTPDIVAHLDRIKMHNPDNLLWSEDEGWYQDLIADTLKAIRDKGIVMEINTKGMYRDRKLEPYPSYWIIREAVNMGIPIHLAADAHHPADLTGAFSTVKKRLQVEGIDHDMSVDPFIGEKAIAGVFN